MKMIGITGGIGSGKSQVLAFLKREYHACVYEADEIAKQLQRQGQDCYKKIVEQFGTAVLQGNGELDREKLGDIVFLDPDQLHILNQIVHPAVKKYVQEQALKEEKQGTKLFVLEAALLLEDKYDAVCDELWYIYTDEIIRRERLKISRGYTDEKINRILENQAKEETFRNGCQITLDNSGCFATTCAQIRGVLQKEKY